MTHALPVIAAPKAQPNPLTLDARVYRRGLSCVHCGLCLPACPTYTQTYNEADSPRGRIVLMLALSDGRIQPTDSVVRHLDLCLDCRACETACPSGVVYHELIEQMRQRLDHHRAPSLQTRLMRVLFFHIFTRPTRLKLALLPVRLMQKIGVYGLLRKTGLMRLLPMQLQKMEQMLPEAGSLWPRRARGQGPTTASRRVAFFTGCVGSVMYDRVNQQAIDLLALCGVRVLVPPQVCCGAIHHHNAAEHPAKAMARRNIDTLMPEGGPEPEMIVTTIAGCGAMLREYDVLLRDDPHYADRARRFVAKVRDVSEALIELGLGQPEHAVTMQATYHDACHLAHAQRVTLPPRQLLSRVKGLTLRPLTESDICCGAAGTYNLTQPAMARELAVRKLANVASTGATICITGNVGCAMHIQSQARERRQDLRVLHPVEVLHAAHFGPSP